MLVKEIFDQLTHGELSNIHLGGADVGVIDPSNYPKMLAHMNLGLTALYKRFPLKQQRVVIPLEAGKFTYTLAVTDLFKVEAVYTEGGKELGLNDEADIHAISTPSAAVLRVPPVIVAKSSDLPDELKTSSLEIVYRANHPAVLLTGFDINATAVELPYTHLEPLLLFIASRINNPIGMTPQTEFNAGNNYASKYEKSCLALELTNLRVDQGSQYNKLARNGWV